MKSVVIQFEFVHANLPPTLSATQVQNVRKIMKIQLLDLVRTSPNASTCLNNIYQLLLDLGVTKSEFEKALSQLGSSGARQGSAINPKISGISGIPGISGIVGISEVGTEIKDYF